MATRLQQIREGLGFTVDEIAQAAEMSRAQFRALEASDDPDATETLLLSDLYGVDVDGWLEDPTRTVEEVMPVAPLLRAESDDVAARDRLGMTEAMSVARDLRELESALGMSDWWKPVSTFRNVDGEAEPAQAEDLARRVRARIARDHGELIVGGAVRSVTEVLSRLRVAVLWVDVFSPRIDAASFASEELGGVIVANRSGAHMQTAGSLRVTLLHELCHVLFDRGQMRRMRHLDDDVLDDASAGLERRARAFPPYVLAPRDAVNKHWRTTQRKTPAERVSSVMRTFGLGYQTSRHHLHHMELLDISVEVDGCARDERGWDREASSRMTPTVRDARQSLVPLIREALAKNVVSRSRAREMLRLSVNEFDELIGGQSTGLPTTARTT